MASALVLAALLLPAGGRAAGGALEHMRPPPIEHISRIELAHVHVRTFSYVANDGRPHLAYVVLPDWYDEVHWNPPLPLVIAPHGRGTDARSMLRRFGKLPALGTFALVSPEGQGRRFEHFSWGYTGQVDDLARMPGFLTAALPWLRIDRSRIYAFGTSMGGQEVLLLAARHPELLAGVAAFDSTVDLALQYRNFSKLRCSPECRRNWNGPLVHVLRAFARREIGGSPRTARHAFAVRSPLSYARQLAESGVAVQLWWTKRDRIVRNPLRQSRALFDRLSVLNPAMHLEGFVGDWPHARVMHDDAGLPLALARFGLLGRRDVPANAGVGIRRVTVSAPPRDRGCAPGRRPAGRPQCLRGRGRTG